MTAGTKRGSPGADAEKNPIADVELDAEGAKKLEDITKVIQRVELLLERQAQARLAPVYAQRREVLKTINKFWPVALMNNPMISLYTTHTADRTALSFLEDLWVERDSSEPRCYKIEFYFKENPYFSDTILTKSCKYIPPPAAAAETADADGIKDSMLEFSWDRDVQSSTHKINWKNPETSLTKLYPRLADDEDEEDVTDAGSFFNFFELENDPYEFGNTIVNEIFPDAIDFFLGRAAGMLEDDDDDDDEDDDDAEEIDLEEADKPKKKQKV